MPTIYEFKHRIYAITDKVEGKFIVIKSRWLASGKKLVEELRSVKAEDVEEVKRRIRDEGYDSFDKLSE